VEFTFSPEQDALRGAVRSFLADRAPGSYLRAMIDDGRGFTDDVWQAVVELGWPALLVPEAHGGLGLGLVDLVVIQEEMGRALFPGPWFSSAVFATLAARGLGAGDLLAGLASGATLGTVALEEPGSGDPIVRVAARADTSGRLTGTKPFVLDGHTADWALVVARDDDGALGSYLLEAPSAQVVPALDPTRKLTRLVLDGRAATRVGPPGDQTTIWRRVVDDAAVALCAEMVGVCEQAFSLAVEYAKVRVQFDRPIARFQVIQHKAADMLHRFELARVGTHYAAWTSDVDDPARETAAAMAKGYAGEAAVAVTAEDIQIHGGVGYTWDCDAHLFYKRAKQNDLFLGAQGWQRRRLADLVLG